MNTTSLLKIQLGIVREMQTEIKVVFISCVLSKIKFNQIRSIHKRMILISERIYRLGFFSHCIVTEQRTYYEHSEIIYYSHNITNDCDNNLKHTSRGKNCAITSLKTMRVFVTRCTAQHHLIYVKTISG